MRFILFKNAIKFEVKTNLMGLYLERKSLFLTETKPCLCYLLT